MDRCDKCQGCLAMEWGRDGEGQLYEQVYCLNCAKRFRLSVPEPKHIPTQRGGNAPNAGWFR